MTFILRILLNKKKNSMKKKYFIILLSAILCSGFVLAYKKSQKINPITKNIINSKYNNDKNDYFIIREPDSIFFTKNGQEHILKDYNVLVFENREENENNGIEMFMNKLKDKLKKDKNIDILYSRPQKTKDITFHWNVFSIYYAKQENNSIYLILNDNDKKAEEMQTLLKEIIKSYPDIKVIYLPKIQYSHKGCSVKAAMFVKELHKNNDEFLKLLLKIGKNNNEKHISIQELFDNGKLSNEEQMLIIKRYTKFIQQDSIYNSYVMNGFIKNKHYNGTKIKTDKKTKKDIYIKNSKLHDKGYSILYKILLNDKEVKEGTKITKEKVLILLNNR